MAFELACTLDEVPTDQALAVTLGRYDVAVARDGDEVFAVENTCSHAEVALSEGEVAESRRFRDLELQLALVEAKLE